MGSRNRSGVTDNNDAPGDYMIRSEVADGLGEGLCCRLHDLAKRKGKQVLCVAMEMLNPPVCQQSFGDRIAALMAVAIDHDLPEHAFIRHTVPNPVVEPVARMGCSLPRRKSISPFSTRDLLIYVTAAQQSFGLVAVAESAKK